MKLKSCMLLAATLVGLAFFSCSGNDGGTETPSGEFTLSNFELSDTENQGNGSDIVLNYSITSDLSVLKELRLFVSKTTLSQDQATQVSGSGYKTLPATASQELTLDADLKDTDGNLISEATSYQVYLLGVFQNTEIASILSGAVSFTLKNETLVTSMELTGPFNAMEDIAMAGDGTLYVNGGGTSPNNLYKVTPEGVSSILSNELSGAVGIDLDSEGNIYSSNFNNTTIKMTTPAGVTTNLVTDNRLTGGGGLAFDNDGNLFNTFFSSATLYNITDGVVNEFITSNQFNGPVGMTYDKARGELYVASFNSGKIFNVSAAGTVTEVADSPATIGHLAYANDHFYVTGWNEHKVYKVSRTGEIVETIGRGTNADLDGPSASAQFSQPNGIAVSPDGRYVFVSQGNGRLRKIIMARDN